MQKSLRAISQHHGRSSTLFLIIISCRTAPVSPRSGSVASPPDYSTMLPRPNASRLKVPVPEIRNDFPARLVAFPAGASADVRDCEKSYTPLGKDLAAAVPQRVGSIMTERHAADVVVHDPAPPVTIRVDVVRQVLRVEARERGW